MPEPLLKWAGGKRRILPELLRFVPENYGTYYEPFLGGGALFFRLSDSTDPAHAVLCDTNRDLIDLYRVAREHPEELAAELGNLEYGNNADDYYRARDRYNGYPHQDGPVVRGALLIYLNRHCYNGLYRLNSRGGFNVPFGRYRNPGIPGAAEIMTVSRALSSADLIAGDFEDAVISAGRGDFVYLDPPYHPVSPTSSFTAYSRSGFGIRDQERLAETLGRLDAKGVDFTLSNSANPSLIDLYEGFNIHRIKVGRAINSDPGRRGKVDEIIVTNF